MAKKDETKAKKASEEEVLEEEVTEDLASDNPKEETEEKETEPAKEDNAKDKKDAMIAELNDKVMRQMAEFENFRKRTEKEKAGMYDMGAVSVLEKILPVIDNFERGMVSADDSPFAEGMRMIYKQLMTSLEDMGVSPIPALGETFDPEVHNAVMHEDDPEKGENEISEELLKGYKFHDTVIRHSMVKVAN